MPLTQALQRGAHGAPRARSALLAAGSGNEPWNACQKTGYKLLRVGCALRVTVQICALQHSSPGT